MTITTALLVRGSCGISQPFGDEKKMAGYLADGKHTALRRRLEADVKSLYALYQYGRLHGAVRLRWGFVDERLDAPWAHMGDQRLYLFKQAARDHGVELEAVWGSAPGWGDPWSRAKKVDVVEAPGDWWTSLVAEDGYAVEDAEVQAARLVVTRH